VTSASKGKKIKKERKDFLGSLSSSYLSSSYYKAWLFDRRKKKKEK